MHLLVVQTDRHLVCSDVNIRPCHIDGWDNVMTTAVDMDKQFL